MYLPGSGRVHEFAAKFLAFSPSGTFPEPDPLWPIALAIWRSKGEDRSGMRSLFSLEIRPGTWVFQPKVRVAWWCAHSTPLRPSWLGASEDSSPDDSKGAQKASLCGRCGLSAGACRWLRLPLTVSQHQAQVRDHGCHRHLQARLASPKVSTFANAQLHQPRDAMLYHHPFSQALAPRLGLVVGAGLLLQAFLGLDSNGARPFPPHALGAQGAGLTGGGGKHEASTMTFSRRPIVVRRLPRWTAHFHLL